MIIEKPIFIYKKQIKKIQKSSNFEKNIIIEGFMHRYTKMYNEFLRFWKLNSNNVLSLKSSFCIPEIPMGTFRDSDDISSSCLYDIGCYGISLINDIGLDLDNINIHSFVEKKSKLVRLSLNGFVQGIYIEINFGKDKNYENYIEVTTNNQKKISFSPFFYGRETEKTIKYNNNDKEVRFVDNNAFQQMFNLNLHHLHLSQKKRFQAISKVTRKLESLASQYEILKSKQKINNIMEN